MKIFDYDSCGVFIKNYINDLPKKGRGEAKRMAELLNISSTLISQIISEDKFFTPEQIQKLAVDLNFTELESDYFYLLNQYERSGTTELKKYLKKKLSELKVKSLDLSKRVKTDQVLSENNKAIFFSSAVYSSIWLFTSVGSNGKSLTEIMERFEISRLKALSVLYFLLEVGLCIEKNEKYHMGKQSTHLEQGSPYLSRHYINWHLKALSQIDTLSADELMYSAPVSLAKKDFLILREELAAYINKFVKLAQKSEAEDIACLNIDWFWLKK